LSKNDQRISPFPEYCSEIIRRNYDANGWTEEIRLGVRREAEDFDKLHFEMENKLLALVASLQKKRKEGTWEEELRESRATSSP
jgi:hypothetical protein